jgi:hypothetical protein
MIDFKRYFIKIYRKGKIIKTVDLYSTYEDIEKGALNKAVVLKNQDGYYLDIHFFDKADRFEIEEIGE